MAKISKKIKVFLGHRLKNRSVSSALYIYRIQFLAVVRNLSSLMQFLNQHFCSHVTEFCKEYCPFKKIIFWIASSLVMKHGVISIIPRPNAGPWSGDRRISPGQRSQSPKTKAMLICFFDIRGIIHFEFVPEGTTVNHTFYKEVLKRLTDALRHKRGEL
jgi:hypothetical protein